MTKNHRNWKIKFPVIFLSFIGLITIFNGCVPIFPTYPPGANCTFGIPDLPDFACFTNHSNSGRKIKLLINIKVTFLYQSKKTDFSDQSISVEPISGPSTIFPVQLAALIPNDGTPYDVEVNVKGEECSTCANGYSDPSENPVVGNCPATTITTTTPLSYLAAKPRWSGKKTFTSYNTTYNFSEGPPRIGNVPNSCVCTVN